jgi:hypothetical protein
LLKKAAEQGLASAQNNLGSAYREGEGVHEDDAKAVCWYRKAAEQGDALAQTNLSSMYAEGKGVPENNVKGAEALYNLGVIYQAELGVPQNNQTAGVQLSHEASGSTA